MNYDAVAELTDKQITELYNDILETEYVTNCNEYFKVLCQSGARYGAEGYFKETNRRNCHSGTGFYECTVQPASCPTGDWAGCQVCGPGTYSCQYLLRIDNV